jgi:glycine/D-amino acid oxidase-like deaminating enzyme
MATTRRRDFHLIADYGTAGVWDHDGAPLDPARLLLSPKLLIWLTRWCARFQMSFETETGDARGLQRRASGWRVETTDGPMEAAQAVVALGAASTEVTQQFGYAPPHFGKWGLPHALQPARQRRAEPSAGGFGHGVRSDANATGIRLTTGVEFARTNAPPKPAQLQRVETTSIGACPLRTSSRDMPYSKSGRTR